MIALLSGSFRQRNIHHQEQCQTIIEKLIIKNEMNRLTNLVMPLDLTLITDAQAPFENGSMFCLKFR